jgi:uracil-DNA glycosylase
MSTTHSSFLKEMDITEWTSREAPASVAAPLESLSTDSSGSQAPERPLAGHWWFFGTRPQGDAQTLFNNLIRVLGLSPSEWEWKSPEENLSKMNMPDNGLPLVAFSFGGPSTQKITGERDPLPQLRETVLALNSGTEEDIPVIASFDLAHAVSSPKDKALLWQDLLLAKSVLQNL